jgi:uncharacterized protein (TIGR04255 family)
VVLDIECDFPPGQPLAAFGKRATGKFHDRYPKLRTQIVQNLVIRFNPGNPVENDTPAPNLQALQFLQDDQKQLVQLREKGYVFNRLYPYSSLDNYLPEILRTRNIYRELAVPIRVQVVRLRYIGAVLV